MLSILIPRLRAWGYYYFTFLKSHDCHYGIRYFVNVHLLMKCVVHSRLSRETLNCIDWLSYDGVENKSFTIRNIYCPVCWRRTNRINSSRITFVSILKEKVIYYQVLKEAAYTSFLLLLIILYLRKHNIPMEEANVFFNKLEHYPDSFKILSKMYLFQWW